MKILIFGAGAVGSVIGGFLARLGNEVTLFGRPWHLDVVRKQGLTITGLWGSYRIKALETCTDLQALRAEGAAYDLIVLTVKSFDTEKAVSELRPLMKPDTMLLSLQNGLGNVEAILRCIPAEQLLIGRFITGVELKPGEVNITVSADAVVIGSVPGITPKVNPVKVASVFTHSKIETRAVPDILTQLWSKVIYNCALNAICSLHEMPYGRILDDDDTRKDMQSVVHECYAVAGKKGIALNPTSPEAYLELLTSRLIPATAAHYPSMLQDLRRGKQTEIESLNGAIVRLGRETDIPTSVNERLTKTILSKSSAVKISNNI